MSRCTHAHGVGTVCFECFRNGMETTRARRRAWAQRSLPFDAVQPAATPLSPQALAHRRQMLEYLASIDRRQA
jgi:hypothetical protein